jgi:hypothetical protein
MKDEDRDLLDSGFLHLTSLRSPEKDQLDHDHPFENV